MLNKSQEKIVKAIRELKKGTSKERILYLDIIRDKTGIARSNLSSKYLPILFMMGIVKYRSPYIIDEKKYRELTK